MNDRAGGQYDRSQIGEGELTEEQQLHRENIIDRYKHPLHRKRLPETTVAHAGVNPSCGDTLQVELRIVDGVVVEVGFQGAGCAISQASMDLLAERITGKRAEEVLGLGREDIVGMLGIPIGIVRMKCALLSLRTTQSAIQKAESEQHAQVGQKVKGEQKVNE